MSMHSEFGMEDAKLQGVKIITPFYMEDERGYFLKNMERDIFQSFGLCVDISENIESYSKKDVIRGLHFQTEHPQTKIVRVIRGAVLDVLVDLRKGSDTFGQWEGFELSGQNHKTLWVPAGFAHGFQVLSEDAIVSYQCIGRYLKGYDTGIVWNDPEIGIRWSVTNPIVSEKDSRLQSFASFQEGTGSLIV